MSQVYSSFQLESSFAAWWKRSSAWNATEVFLKTVCENLRIFIEMAMIQKVQEISIAISFPHQ